MGATSWHLLLFFLCISLNSGLGTAIRLRGDSSYEFSTQFDSIPIVNPTTPGTGNPYPTINPTSPQPPDTSTGQTPTPPDTTTPTPPDTTTPTNPPSPTNPYTSPTTNPYTSPTTNPYTSPTTNPYTSPTTNPYTSPTTTPNPVSSGGGGGGGGSGGGQWCVASESAAETTLKVALDYACGYGADCSQLQQGGACYDPNTLKDHASYAFNDYYQKNPAPTSCVFGGVATLTNKDPSHGNCHFSSSKTTSMSPPTYVSPPNPPSPPTPMTPTIMSPTTPTIMTPTSPGMTMPGDDGGSSTVYGSPPNGSPNIATSISYSILFLLTTSLYATLHVQNYI